MLERTISTRRKRWVLWGAESMNIDLLTLKGRKMKIDPKGQRINNDFQRRKGGRSHMKRRNTKKTSYTKTKCQENIWYVITSFERCIRMTNRRSCQCFLIQTNSGNIMQQLERIVTRMIMKESSQKSRWEG